MIQGVEVSKLEVRSDDRGWLAEVLRKSRAQGAMSQLYVTVALPGKVKGKHYHRRKVEWFCVVHGEATLFLKDTRSGREEEVPMGEKNLVTVRIPPLVAHAIVNTGKSPCYLIVIVSEEFNPEDPDTLSFDFPGI